MTDLFDRAFAIVFLAEGDGNDPRDPGGKTKHGLSDLADGKADGAYHGLDLDAATVEQIKTRYRLDYWNRACCDEMPWPLCLFMFDAAVNQGPGAAVKLLQKAAGVAQDGIFGRRTKAAVAATDQRELLCLFMADRALRYTGTRNFDIYGRGWFKRLFFVTMEA